MNFELIMIVHQDNGAQTTISLGEIERDPAMTMATLGLSLGDGKLLTARIQRAMVAEQFAAGAKARGICTHCGAGRPVKDYHGARFRSLYGDIDLRVPRWRPCGCPGAIAATESQVGRRERWVAPELEFVQSQLAATLPYARTTELLGLLLPLGKGASPSTVRDRLMRVGQRLEGELAALPQSGDIEGTAMESGTTTVGLDGGYVRHASPGSTHSFEIIAGRVLPENQPQRSVAFVRSIDVLSRARIHHVVTAGGAEGSAPVVFTDGDSQLRQVQMSLFPAATHILDWYHLTRQLTVLASVIDGQEMAKQLSYELHDRLSKLMQSAKWRLWHGRSGPAIAQLERILCLLKRPSLARKPVVVRATRLGAELHQYLRNNADSMPNYGRRYRAGERICTSFVESAVNQIISKRMVKSQQMRWQPTSAHLLLQVRVRVIDGTLRDDFQRWYPGFAANDATIEAAA